jgi:UPF0716 protein FxsA
MVWLIGGLVLMAAEVVVLVEVAHVIGVLAAVALLVVISACGPALVRRSGLGVWRRARERVAAGSPPGVEALDGIETLAGGLLVCVPGFITDVVGLTLLLPPVRALVRRVVLHHLLRRYGRFGRFGRRSPSVIDVGSHPTSSPPGRGPGGPPGALEPPR